MDFQEESEGFPLFSPNLKLRTKNRIKHRKRSRQQWLKKHINRGFSLQGAFR